MIKVISVIGFSGSGKTFFILNAIGLLKKNLNFNVAVIKNIHEHQIDQEGKDSYEFSRYGAKYSITKNQNNETTVFIRSELSIEKTIEWISRGPFKIDLIFIEGFRNLHFPTVLCLRGKDELESQISSNVKVISGTICSNKSINFPDLKIPLIDVKKDFIRFLEIFGIK